MSMAPSPAAAYRQAIHDGELVDDPAQHAAVAELDACHQRLHASNPHRGPRDGIPGVYLWGPVGRGKTWLMDSFHRALAVPARRQHFHHFMRWVHRRQFQLSGSRDPLVRLAEELATELRVLCLDELFVSDIADAMLLGGLLTALFDRGVVLVVTSNQKPNQLYADGFNRERLMPAIAAIQAHTRVVALHAGQDHRLRPGPHQRRYWVVETAWRGQATPLASVYAQLAAGQAESTEALTLGHRTIEVERRSASVLWCRYAALCEQPLSALDFIALCDRFSQLLLSEVPRLSAAPQAASIARGTEDGVQRVDAGDRELPSLSRHDDGVRRFIALVDECYDRGIPLYIEAEVPLDSLYTQGYLAFAFRRTLSRLHEMQLKRFAAHRGNLA
ncbi:cell division protein ZapE [Modicisalibacter radicis]|uniref:cell division protein ZapE n=1 Tax=Halomonas sp. EAR18 TaxID=2518972 RepID=UPI00109C10C3|nr:cell division protein ZapE [Halomonas sp. EAR18]